MATTESGAVLVCLRVSEDSIGSVVPGSTQGTCCDCDHRVWISKSGQEFIAQDPTTRFRCMECLETIIRDDPSVLQEILKTAKVVPGGIQEAVDGGFLK